MWKFVFGVVCLLNVCYVSGGVIFVREGLVEFFFEGLDGEYFRFC